MKKVIAVIFAGGSGVRMGAGKPKQFLEVIGKPIIIHTLEIFELHPEVDEIIIPCKEDYMEPLKRMIRRYDISKVRRSCRAEARPWGRFITGLWQRRPITETMRWCWCTTGSGPS
ncbi:MAG: 2-C-methyl-D-erythritol 4-phosphate cytidylyltransferase [Bacillota bacterium]|nr:2-C-methyl-D-erythritol 4-phosphate cytidylyltransferase [Bacillota bacterium]